MDFARPSSTKTRTPVNVEQSIAAGSPSERISLLGILTTIGTYRNHRSPGVAENYTSNILAHKAAIGIEGRV